MEVKLCKSLQFATLVDSNKLGRKPSIIPLVNSRPGVQERRQLLISCHSQQERISNSHKHGAQKASSHSCRNSPGPILQSGCFPASFDEAMILKNKAEEIEPYLDGRNIYLVGMMGSGKTTVGKVLSKSLGYSCFDCPSESTVFPQDPGTVYAGGIFAGNSSRGDCDTLIQQAVGRASVAEIFELHGESYFRDNETEELRKLSMMRRLVVSTGGGAVVRPINWKYMGKGISVWLDVPLEALARRIAAEGTQSRPLLHHESGDAYTEAFTTLSTLLEERGESYANASARVCLEHIAAKLGYIDVCNLTPTVIAIEALERIKHFLVN